MCRVSFPFVRPAKNSSRASIRVARDTSLVLEPSDGRKAYTMDFSGKTRPQILQLLKENGVEQLLDVRWFPGSQHRPDVSKNNLAKACRASDINYVHLKALGAPPDLRKLYKIAMYFDEFINDYARYVVTQQEWLRYLVSLTIDKRSVLFCTEADWRECHRKNLTALLEGHQFDVIHL